MPTKPVALQFRGKTIGFFTDGGYESPWFHYGLRALDPAHADRLAKVSAFESQMACFEDEPDDVYEVKAQDLCKGLDLSASEAGMYFDTLSVTYDDGRVHRIGPAYLDGRVLSWRNGEVIS